MTYSVIEPGKTSSHHIHPWEHEVYILEGEGEIVGEEGAVSFRAGDCCYTAPNELHQFRNTGTNRVSGLTFLTVPEPASATCAAMAVALMLARRSKR